MRGADLSHADEARIAEAVRAAEATTAGEIVCVVADSAGDYRFVPLMWAALIGLAAPWPFVWFTDWEASRVLGAQLVVFAAVACAFSFTGLRFWVTPRRFLRERAHQAAREQFRTREIHRTRDRAGVMIYAALAENYAEVIADAGIGARVDPGVWTGIAARLEAGLASQRNAEALIAAVGEIGAELARHFPPPGDEHDELADHVVRV